jgi:hypothetical protein
VRSLLPAGLAELQKFNFSLNLSLVLAGVIIDVFTILASEFY